VRNINIKDLKIEINLSELLSAIDSTNSFDIDVDGTVYLNNTIPKNNVVIFSAKAQGSSNLFDMQTKVKNLFGKDYKPQIVGSQCIITPLPSWMHILDLNQETMLYFDHQSDGVEFYENPDIEDIGWNAAPLDIKYRELCTFMEENCEGTFLFYDNEVHFNGFVVVDDVEAVRVALMKFVSGLIYAKIGNDELDIEELDEDQADSLMFFEIE